MAIDNKAIGALNAYKNFSDFSHPSQHATQKKTEQAAENSQALQNSQVHGSQMTIRNERQASLVAHLFGDGKDASANSLKLTFQAAIDKLNEVLQEQMNIDPESGQPAPISEEALKVQGGIEYWTPENTAKRIVEGATAFMAGFQNAHPDLQGEELINQFMDVVGGGLTQGFEDARGILGDLNVLEGDIATNIDATYELVQQKMQDYKNQFLGIEPDVTTTVDNTEQSS